MIAERLQGVANVDALRELRAFKSRRRLADFIRYGWKVLEPGVPLLWNWHIEAVADHVQWVLEDWARRQSDATFVQRAQNLLINIPPGTAKSRIVSVYAPAWAWLHWPAWRAICLSANPRVALRDAMYSREVIESDWYRSWFRPGWKLADDDNAKGHFGNTAGGSRSSMGMTAKITGERADAIIVDDPNDAQEVNSEPMRTAVTERWDAAIGNRVNDLRSSVRIGVMQRVHELDWSGHVLAQGGWAHLCLPMEFDPKRACETPFGWRDPRTVAGEILHPERFPPEVLAAERRRLGSYGYAGQMDQLPAPAEGGIFKFHWFGTYQTLPDQLEDIVISVDCAAKKTTDGSNTAIQAWARKGPHRYMIDDVTGHFTTSETVTKILALRTRVGAKRVLVEEKAAGPSVIEELQTKVPGILPINPGADSKESRAMAIQAEVEGGAVLLPAGAPWAESFLHEVCSFPMVAREDRVDAMTQALNYWRISPAAMRFAMRSSW